MATKTECDLCGIEGYIGVDGVYDPDGEWVTKRVLSQEWRGVDLGNVTVCRSC